MNWITDYVKPKLQSFVHQKEIADNLWHSCKKCGQMIFHKEFKENQNVCPSCGHHHYIAPRHRYDGLFDEAIWHEVPFSMPTTDPLKFKDTKKYTDRLKEAKQKTGEKEGILIGSGKINQIFSYAVAHDFAFMGGSMGIAVGNALLEASHKAVKEKAPLIVFPSAGGARMQEGILSLMQMPRTTIAVEQMKEAGLPFIVVLTHPTTGGVTASYAMLGDIHIAEPDALICFTGPRVIEQTIKEKLPEGFQKSEYLLDHGMVDMIVPRTEMNTKIGTILSILMKK